MKHVLTNWVLGKSPIISITEDDYLDLQNCQTCLYELLLIEQKYDNIIENYLEYENYLMDVAHRNTVNRNFIWTSMRDASNTIQRKIMNLLNSSKAFIEQSMHHLKMILPDEPKSGEEYKSFISDLYDNYLGYRVMEALRNHSQHFNFPAPHLSINMQRVDRSTHNQLLISVTPSISVKDISKNKKFKRSILSEIKVIGDLADIKPLLREYVSCISRVLIFLRGITKDQKNHSDKKIMWALDKISNAVGETQISNPAAAISNEDGTMRAEVIINDELIQLREKYEEKNQDISHLARQFASGEVAKDS